MWSPAVTRSIRGFVNMVQTCPNQPQLRLGFSGYSTRGGTSFSSSSGLRSNWSSGRTFTSGSSYLLQYYRHQRSHQCQQGGDHRHVIVVPCLLWSLGGRRAARWSRRCLVESERSRIGRSNLGRSRLRHGGFGSHFASPAPSAKLHKV